MKAIILAAGRSSRLYPLTRAKPKCLLKVGGKRIIDHQIENLRRINIDDIVLVIGHKKEKLMNALGDSVRYRVYDNFARTNNLHTLWHVRDELNTDCLILFADVLFPHELLAAVTKRSDNFCMLVDTNGVREGTMRITHNGERLTGIGSHIAPHEGHGNFIGIAYMNAKGAKQLINAMKKLIDSGNHVNNYYTIAIDALAKTGTKIAYHEVGGYHWHEIDTLEDLKQARKMFSSKLSLRT